VRLLYHTTPHHRLLLQLLLRPGVDAATKRHIGGVLQALAATKLGACGWAAAALHTLPMPCLPLTPPAAHARLSPLQCTVTCCTARVWLPPCWLR
jgi:hypothetical protein